MNRHCMEKFGGMNAIWLEKMFWFISEIAQLLLFSYAVFPYSVHYSRIKEQKLIIIFIFFINCMRENCALRKILVDTLSLLLLISAHLTRVSKKKIMQKKFMKMFDNLWNFIIWLCSICCLSFFCSLNRESKNKIDNFDFHQLHAWNCADEKTCDWPYTIYWFFAWIYVELYVKCCF